MKEKVNKIDLESKKINKRKVLVRVLKISFIFLLLVLSVIYFMLYVVNSKGFFTVTLDGAEGNTKNIFLSEDGNVDGLTIKLTARSLDYMDNISGNWIKTDVDTEANGSHNGTNYFAYTFYVINYGNETVNYHYQINVLDSIKGADEAIRVKVFLNGEDKTYAKPNRTTGLPEEGTIPFFGDAIPVLEERTNFAPQDKDRFTIVIWLEGDDPECINDILGGEVKLDMQITEEHLSGDGR